MSEQRPKLFTETHEDGTQVPGSAPSLQTLCVYSDSPGLKRGRCLRSPAALLMVVGLLVSVCTNIVLAALCKLKLSLLSH